MVRGGEPGAACTAPWLGLSAQSVKGASQGKEKAAGMPWHCFLTPAVTFDTDHFMSYFFQMCVVSSNGSLIPAKLFGLALLLRALICLGLVRCVAWSYRCFPPVQISVTKLRCDRLLKHLWLAMRRFSDADALNHFHGCKTLPSKPAPRSHLQREGGVLQKLL